MSGARQRVRHGPLEQRSRSLLCLVWASAASCFASSLVPAFGQAAFGSALVFVPAVLTSLLLLPGFPCPDLSAFPPYHSSSPSQLCETVVWRLGLSKAPWLRLLGLQQPAWPREVATAQPVRDQRTQRSQLSPSFCSVGELCQHVARRGLSGPGGSA